MKKRWEPSILNHSRKQRVAHGSGHGVEDVELLLKQYQRMKKMKLKFKSKPEGDEPPPAKTAIIPIPKKALNILAIGKKYCA